MVLLSRKPIRAMPRRCSIVSTKNLAAHTTRADILIVAIGSADMITGDMVKEGAVVVVDVGVESGKCIGEP